jgi:hypothetical protein
MSVQAMTHCSMQPQPVRRRIFFNEFFARGCVFKLERWKQP